MLSAYFSRPAIKISCLSLKYWYTIPVETPADLAIFDVSIL